MTDTWLDLSGKLPSDIEAVLQQVAGILVAQNAQTRLLITSILERETATDGKYQLISSMVAGCRFLDDNVDRAFALLEAVALGMGEIQ